MSHREVNIIEIEPTNKIKYCIIGAPDVGLVGAICTDYLIRSLNMKQIGYVESDAFDPVIVVHQGAPEAPVRIYTNDSVTAFISETPIGSHALAPVARAIVDWAKAKNVELLISVSGVPIENRLEVDFPQVFGVGTSPEIRNSFKKGNIEPFEEGFMVGLHALVVRECLKKGVNSVVLLAQSHLQYPDPGAAASAINALNSLLGLHVDVKKLQEQEEEIRLKLRDLMRQTQRSMAQTPKGREQEIPIMYA
jgi:uncharacterized protein